MEKEPLKEGLLIIISGPSGVGKGTIRRQVMGDGSLNLAYSVSMTTRERRINEIDGVDYFFVSKEEFQRNIDNGNFLEWAEFVGNRYGTPKHYVDALRRQGKNVVLEIEVEGTKQVLSRCKGSNVVSIFVIPPSYEDLERRIRHRSTEPEDIIQKRLAKARKEMHLKYHYEYVVLNDRPDRAGKEIREIIRNKLNAKLIK
ncbi:MAG: guanylate kinase [Bacilli bacterium]|jgi:guanylate kinase|nr:guanylate kinase [Bacilli bacterium]MDD4005915.1 guanylate kinase [Bacilli bacterium]